MGTRASSLATPRAVVSWISPGGGDRRGRPGAGGGPGGGGEPPGDYHQHAHQGGHRGDGQRQVHVAGVGKHRSTVLRSRRRVLAGSGIATVGLGLLVIGPSTFLPVYGQAVLGLGAVAAGGVLASMSLGWPLSTSQ